MQLRTSCADAAFVALRSQFPSAGMALLPRRFRCSGRGRPCAPVRLAIGDLGPCACRYRCPAGVASEPATLPPVPSSLSVVRLRVSVDEGGPRYRLVLRPGQTSDNVSPPQQKLLGGYGEDTQKWASDNQRLGARLFGQFTTSPAFRP